MVVHVLRLSFYSRGVIAEDRFAPSGRSPRPKTERS